MTNWHGVNTDISTQIEAEAAFARSEAKFRVLAEAMPQIIWEHRGNEPHSARTPPLSPSKPVFAVCAIAGAGAAQTLQIADKHPRTPKCLGFPIVLSGETLVS